MELSTVLGFQLVAKKVDTSDYQKIGNLPNAVSSKYFMITSAVLIHYVSTFKEKENLKAVD